MNAYTSRKKNKVEQITNNLRIFRTKNASTRHDVKHANKLAGTTAVDLYETNYMRAAI